MNPHTVGFRRRLQPTASQPVVSTVNRIRPPRPACLKVLRLNKFFHQALNTGRFTCERDSFQLRLKTGYSGSLQVMTVYCESMVRYVVPALRMLISRQLLENYNLNQVQVARLLNVTQPSVSNYTGRRKSSAKIRRYVGNAVVNEYADSLAKKIFENGLTLKELESDICSLCTELRKTGCLTG